MYIVSEVCPIVYFTFLEIGHKFFVKFEDVEAILFIFVSLINTDKINCSKSQKKTPKCELLKRKYDLSL